jgi:hypothetical protein
MPHIGRSERNVRQSAAREPVSLLYDCGWSHDWQCGGPTAVANDNIDHIEIEA